MTTTTTTSVRPNTIQTLMTKDPVCVDGATTAVELAALLREHEISGMPVLDSQYRVIGVVSRTDLLHHCVESPLGEGLAGLMSPDDDSDEPQIEIATLGVVSDFMNTEPVTAQPGESVGAVARRMFEERVHRVIVVDPTNHVLGIVTSLDMLSRILD